MGLKELGYFLEVRSGPRAARAYANLYGKLFSDLLEELGVTEEGTKVFGFQLEKPLM